MKTSKGNWRQQLLIDEVEHLNNRSRKIGPTASLTVNDNSRNMVSIGLNGEHKLGFISTDLMKLY